MPALVAGIHVFADLPRDKTWMAGTNPAMTTASSRFAAFDIVVVPFPSTDRLAEKRRPGLVISDHSPSHIDTKIRRISERGVCLRLLGEDD